MQLCSIFGSQIHILCLQQHDIMPALACSVQLNITQGAGASEMQAAFWLTSVCITPFHSITWH